MERVEKARKASRELLTALNLQAAPPTRCDAVESGTEQKPGQNVTEKKQRSSDRLFFLLFFYRKQFIQLKPIRAMIELSDRIWGRLGLSAVRAVPLEEPRAPSAEAAVTELRPRGAAWTRELLLHPLPGQQVFTDAMRLLVPLALGSMA